jgi:protein-tyrosine phosphatase
VDLDFKYPARFEQVKFPLDDCESQKITNHFNEAYEFIEAQRKKTNVLVHCAAGISRSSAILISYMMRKYGLDYDIAFEMVRQKRSCVQPNSGFERQLREYEEELTSKK